MGFQVNRYVKCDALAKRREKLPPLGRFSLGLRCAFVRLNWF